MKLASERAQRQFGAIARRQLLAVGFTARQVESWLRRGRLFPQYPGVYAWGRPDLSVEGQHAAALLFAGRGSALTSLTALWWRGLLGRRPAQIHIDAPGRRHSQRGLLIRHPTDIARESHRGLPVVPLVQALLAATAFLSHDSLRLVLARADFEKVLDLAALDAALGPGRPGSGAVHRALASHLPALAACSNAFERDFALFCERHAVPIPEPNARIGRYRPDMLWREQRLIVELDGRDAHSSAAQIAADNRRQAREALSRSPGAYARSAVSVPGRSIRHIVGPLGNGSSPSSV